MRTVIGATAVDLWGPAMTRITRHRAGRNTLGALVALAVVVTAGAPAAITVRSGDTLWDLARSHGTTVAALRRLNDLPGNATIYAGENLRVGTGSPTTASSTYLVRRGDTLSEIAKRFGTTGAAIRRVNAMRSSTVYAGQRLRLPGKVTSTSPTTNAGKRIPEPVRAAVARNRAILADRSHPSKLAVRRMVAATARRHGVSPSLAVAVAFHESGFQQRVVSPVNAIGVMQVLPRTASVLGRQHGRSLDLLKTQDNITAGVLLLRQLVRASGTTDRALAGYYQGAGSISRQGILPQTRSYIRSITILRKRFANG